jgi:PTS system nitrogen regulatory IIA component
VRLSVSEAAVLLNAGEEHVYDWIEDGGLPAQRIRGEYRINRTELLEWATERAIPFASRAFADSVKESGIVSVAEALTAGGVVYDVPSADAVAVVRQIVACLPLADEGDREALLQFLLARESFGLAVTGDAIAIPQVRTPVVLPVRKAVAGAPLLSLFFLGRPLMLSASDKNRVVESIFFLVSPTVTSHLSVLARLAASLNDEAFRTAIKRRRSAVDIVQAAADAEGRL